jgi:hypothetical protein
MLAHDRVVHGPITQQDSVYCRLSTSLHLDPPPVVFFLRVSSPTVQQHLTFGKERVFTQAGAISAGCP